MLRPSKQDDNRLERLYSIFVSYINKNGLHGTNDGIAEDFQKISLLKHEMESLM
ncbi:hypothetical protein JAAARDRAFT_594459 [Jaapia argillacea MUCL 33604]|uniref:Uncharacterized protein n=1 Tax=Jaapia argillacea MUCL 33604 TaxID=933084 RepID=A0A067Q1L4_9AGAM|nr:hypothetical protein JAAARDRAFT_594459 [Jaapia argillacea MUCL 33604]